MVLHATESHQAPYCTPHVLIIIRRYIAQQRNLATSGTRLIRHKGAALVTCSSSSSSANWPKTSPYNGSPSSFTGGLPHPPAWYPKFAPGGMGAFKPGTCECEILITNSILLLDGCSFDTIKNRPAESSCQSPGLYVQQQQCANRHGHAEEGVT